METLKLDFRIDREKNIVIVEKEFAAPLDIVWSAWTRSETLEKWWAPQPWKAKTESMAFRENGKWFYVMEGPEGEKHYSIAEYKTIVLEQKFIGLDYFCDEKGNINEELPKSKWLVEFEPEGSHTFVTIETKYESTEDLETILGMGFQEGFTTALLQLDKYLQQEKLG